MEEMSKAKKSNLAYVIVASFFLGCVSGSAFGVLFAISLNQRHYPIRTMEQSPTADIVSSEDRNVIEAVSKVSPSVVSVVVKKDISKLYNSTGPLDFYGFEFMPRQPIKPGQKQEIGGGTGFIISADGLVLTNRHVVEDPEAEYEVVMSDGRSYPAIVKARDTVLDVAVLKVEASGLPVAPLGDSDKLSVGETVIAIGNALSEYRNSVTKGVISAINRRVIAGNGAGTAEILEEALQTDAAINLGNSGGPLVDLKGKVIGVNTAVNRSGQSIGFAIPINAVKVVIDSVKAEGKIIRPWLGVRYTMLTPQMAKENGLIVDYGALLIGSEKGSASAVVPDSPADQAGLKTGDILLEIDGQRLDEAHPLASAIAKKRAGVTVQVRFLREKTERTVPVVLGILPEQIP